MKEKLIFICFFYFELLNPLKNAYDKIFPEDFHSAMVFLKKNEQNFSLIAKKFNQDKELLKAIVSPEIMRYSVVQDLLETSALEILYCKYGSTAADFSVGKFQMKPSFVESLEFEIKKDKDLHNQYRFLLLPEKNTEKQNRELRVSRLKNSIWELNYLSAFVSVCEQKFKEQAFQSKEEKVIFFSTAYNAGFYHSAEKIIEKSAHKLYPYGCNYKGPQYPYSDVALFFYRYHYKK